MEHWGMGEENQENADKRILPSNSKPKLLLCEPVHL